MVLLLAVAGAADLVSAVLRQSILLVYAPDRMRGRLQGVNSVVIAGGPRLGDLRAGAMGAMYGGMIAWVAGGLLAALLAVLLVAFFPVLLRYRSPDPGTDQDSVPDADPGTDSDSVPDAKAGPDADPGSDTEAGPETSVGAGKDRR